MKRGREIGGRGGGEALALLQALEGEKRRKSETWRRLIGQDLSNVDRIREIFERIDREVFMNLAEKFREEGKVVEPGPLEKKI
ncbi:MAG: hypothetical protein D6795_21335 [Deltaproteobacteria bacterium]|nr:MAG: hypothetical protein D6795_21335 [Deltaproteobacteria bacterium]